VTTQLLERTETSALNLEQGLGREALETLSRQLNEPAWVSDRRLEAWRLFRETPWPDWKRTDIDEIEWDRFLVAHTDGAKWSGEGELPPPLQQALLQPEDRSGLLVLDQGAAALTLLDDHPAAQGVYFADLNRAVQEVPERVRAHFGQVVSTEEGKFEALQGAFWNGGTFVYVPAHVEMTLPLQVLHWVDEPEIGVFPRMLIVAEQGSRVTIVEEFVSAAGQEPVLHVGATEIWVGEGAEVTYLSVQEYADNVYHFATERAILNRDSILNWTSAVLGSRLTKRRAEVVLEGNGSTATIQGLYFPEGQQHIAQNTLQHHRAVGTTSDLLYKGVLLDRSRSVYEGLIRVDPGAQRTDAYQANRNLMLSRKARADSMPQLEIEANDVRCSHGATIGQLDEDELFYLMSRGLNRELATRLIVEGFFSPVLDRIPVESVQTRLRLTVQRKLGLEG